MKNYKQIHVAKSEKAYSEVKTRGVTEQSFDKEIMGTTLGLKQPSQQMPGIEMGLCK